MPTPLKNAILILLCCSALVLVCINYVDKPIAFWSYDHHFAQYDLLKWCTYLAPLFIALSIAIYIWWAIRFSYQKINYFDRVLLALANSVVITTFIKNNLKTIFGRSWPQTWTNHNLSLISNNMYSFRFFHGNTAYSSFPSGHTAVIVAAMTVLWLTYPKFRAVYFLAVALVIIGLIGMNYHFVGDVIGGACVGSLVAYFTVKATIFSKENFKTTATDPIKIL